MTGMDRCVQRIKDHYLPAAGHGGIHDVTTNEPGPAGDQNPHRTVRPGPGLGPGTGLGPRKRLGPTLAPITAATASGGISSASGLPPSSAEAGPTISAATAWAAAESTARIRGCAAANRPRTSSAVTGSEPS